MEFTQNLRELKIFRLFQEGLKYNFWEYMNIYFLKKVYYIKELPRQLSSGSVLKTYRLEVPGSVPGRAGWPSRSEYSIVFSETCVNTK